MDKHALSLAGYNALVPGWAYQSEQRVHISGPRGPPYRTLLFVVRRSAVDPEATYRAFVAAARTLMRPYAELGWAWAPTALEAALVQLPERLVQRLACGPGAAKAMLQGGIDTSELRTVPRGTRLLRAVQWLASERLVREVSVAASSESFPEALETALHDPSSHAAGAGLQWAADVVTERGQLEHPYRFASVIGPDSRQTADASVVARVRAGIDRVRTDLAAPAAMESIYDCSAEEATARHLRLVDYLHGKYRAGRDRRSSADS